jgi:hypothetical protein
MHTPQLLGPASPWHKRGGWLALILFVFVLVTWIPGCTGQSAANSIGGKVTLEGKQVSGEVGLIDAKGAEWKKVPIGPTGEYYFQDPPAGQYKFTVTKGPGLGGAIAGPPKDAKDETNLSKGTKIAATVPPPPKYAQPDNGLSIDFKGGHEKKDLELKP